MTSKRRTLMLAAVAGAVLLAGGARADVFSVTREAVGVQNSTATFSFSGVETFNARSPGGGQSFSTDFGTGGVINGNYVGVDIRSADQYGGAGGNTNYASTASATGYTLNLSTTDPQGINYFGFWLSALDGANQVAFYDGATQVFSFSPADVTSIVTAAYYGNPNAPFLGFNAGEPYVFLNFFDTNGTFDRVVFAEIPAFGGGYESDNHTVGFFTDQSGTPIGVPEPGTWAVMIFGLGVAGAALRRRTVPLAGWN